ncbi:MAG TPA: CotH kinase family protein [Candidatus Ventricola gallistercoris]|nr:CotH kinase family protein [Candidatus Ventricola gallistercoris]
MKKRGLCLCLLVMLCVVMAGCTRQETQTEQTPEPEAIREPVAKVPVGNLSEMTLTDKMSLYEEYDPVDPVCFYITIVPGNEADGTNHTFAEINSYENLQGMTGVEKIYGECIFQVGDETGPLPGEVGYDAVGSNATINVRGRTSTGYEQKSYRITLFDSAGMWREQRAIALNKHPGDTTRLRNMLYFELLQGVPGLVSLRTQFVHVYIWDETDPDAPDAFVDYGLFTQVEQPNGRFLRNHGLSQNGNLYKANMCEMYRYEDKIRLATDPLYDVNVFSEVLEPKNDEDHSKLIEMLEAVNNYALPIEEVIGTYFDVENLTSYMAFNLLLSNADSNAQNYYLYSPVNSDKWYYICWDGDAALKDYEDSLLDFTWQEGAWTKGISNYWGVVLFNRMLRVPEYRQALRDKVELLHAQITPERIAELIAKYRQTVDQFTMRMPDVAGLGATQEQLELIYQNMPYDTDAAYQDILTSFERPMPFYMHDVTGEGDALLLGWDSAYDFDGEFIRYDVQVARDWSFESDTLVYESLGQLDTQALVEMLPPGTYYWRVVATNESGYTQIAFDQVETDSGAHEGTRRFVIYEDGTVGNTL